jgi:hypothetical protein
MKLKEIFIPEVWKMLLTLILIVGYFIFNSFLTPNICGNPLDCPMSQYHYNSPNFFGKNCEACISYNEFVIDLMIYLIIQFILPYFVACLILAAYGYGTSRYGKSFKSNERKK